MAELAEDKRDDLCKTFGCWLSQPLSDPLAVRLHFQRLLCFEPLYRGSPPEEVGEIFRCLMPFAWGTPPIHSVALPLIASGSAWVPGLQDGRAMETIDYVDCNEIDLTQK